MSLVLDGDVSTQLCTCVRQDMVKERLHKGSTLAETTHSLAEEALVLVKVLACDDILGADMANYEAGPA
jgi:hypothetical protein